jgi:hypothetical protein
MSFCEASPAVHSVAIHGGHEPIPTVNSPCIGTGQIAIFLLTLCEWLYHSQALALAGYTPGNIPVYGQYRSRVGLYRHVPWDGAEPAPEKMTNQPHSAFYLFLPSHESYIRWKLVFCVGF